ncbi:hypothetical protein [Sphaerimonospora cavernae]|uniref:hypothetical protein n=1 Tax=Sphaerimonospora cavernae TaxID=1740611 RepID=UPI00373FD859
MAANERGDLRRCGLVGVQAGDGVNRDDGGLARLAVGAAAFDLNRLAGVRERQARPDRADLEPTDLASAVRGAVGTIVERNVAPGQVLERTIRELMSLLSLGLEEAGWSGGRLLGYGRG